MSTTPPYGSFVEPDSNELTGAFDISAALTAAADATPQEYFDAQDGSKISINTQLWNAAGDGSSAMSPGGTNCMAEYALGWSGQMNILNLPF
jgi:hypothetical protein